MASVDLVLDLKRPLQVGRPLLILPSRLGVDGVPDDMHMGVLAVAVDETCVVVAGGHPLGQLGADRKQLVVADPARPAVLRVEVVAGVVVLPAPLVGVDLARHVPSLGELVGTLDVEVVRPGRIARLVPLSVAPSVGEVGNHLGGRAAR
jgi:hypothetical protein